MSRDDDAFQAAVESYTIVDDDNINFFPTRTHLFDALQALGDELGFEVPVKGHQQRLLFHGVTFSKRRKRYDVTALAHLLGNS